MPPAVTVLLVPASVRPFEAMKGIDPSWRNGERRQSALTPKSQRSDLLRPITVRMSDDFHQVAAGIVEINTAPAVQVIDLARLGAARIGVIPGALGADAGEGRIELGVADQESIVPRAELFPRIEIECHAGGRLDRNKMAPFRSRLEVEDIGEELGRGPFVLSRDDRVIEFDTHLVHPSRSLFYHVAGLGGLRLRRTGTAYVDGRAPRPSAVSQACCTASS